MTLLLPNPKTLGSQITIPKSFHSFTGFLNLAYAEYLPIHSGNARQKIIWDIAAQYPEFTKMLRDWNQQAFEPMLECCQVTSNYCNQWHIFTQKLQVKLDALEQTTDSNAQKEQDFSDIVFDLKMQASDMCAAAQSDNAALEKVLVKLSTFLRDWIAVLGQELLTPSLDGLTAINLENLQNLASVSIQSNQWDSVAIELQAVAQQKSDVDHTKQNIANLQPLLSTVAQLEQAWELAKKNALQLSGYYGPLNV